MNILVCIKQVPQTESATEIAPSGSWITRAAGTSYKMNRFDEFALEEALQIKERHPGGARVNIVTAGPERARDVVKRAFGMGADDGTHIVLDDDRYADPSVVAGLIAREAGRVPYDLILTGIMSEDMMQSQTGPILAERLGMPCVTSVVAVDVDPDGGQVHVRRETEGGARHLVTVKTPCVLTIQAGINIPRYPTLSKILKANSRDVETIPAGDATPLQTCVQVRLPEKQRTGRVLQGTRDEKARELARILRGKNIMR